MLGEVEGAQNWRRVHEGREQCENGEEVELGNKQELGRVHVVPVTKLVCQDSFDFFRLALLDERVKDDDMFGLI